MKKFKKTYEKICKQCDKMLQIYAVMVSKSTSSTKKPNTITALWMFIYSSIEQLIFNCRINRAFNIIDDLQHEDPMAACAATLEMKYFLDSYATSINTIRKAPVL